MHGKIVQVLTGRKKYYGKVLGEQIDLYDLKSGKKCARVDLFDVAILHEIPDSSVMKLIAKHFEETFTKEAVLKEF